MIRRTAVVLPSAFWATSMPLPNLFRAVGPKVATRDGGYTRIIRTGNRLGDNAEMCLMELVDFNDVYGTEEKKKRSRRSRRGGAATQAAPVA